MDSSITRPLERLELCPYCKKVKAKRDNLNRTENLELAIPRNKELPAIMAMSPVYPTYEVHVPRMSALDGVMEALTDSGTYIIGVCGTDSDEKAVLLEKVSRRSYRDNLFDEVVMASVTRKPKLKRIQAELAVELGLNMVEKSVAKRARCLRNRIKEVQKILVMLEELHKGLDLEKVGIPFGAKHTGCKILLTSTSEEILSNQMHAKKVFTI